MTITRHGATPNDVAAMASFRNKLAANPIAITRASFDALFERVQRPDGIDYNESSVGGVPGVWCLPTAYRAQAAMLYLHGGVFVLGSARAFRHFVAHIVARTSVPAFIADYALAPENPFPAAIDDARAAHRALAAQYGRVAVVGDSAGGGLALSLLQMEPNAACGVLLSPMTDLALTGPSIDSKDADDPFLTKAALEAGVRQYLGDHQRRDPRASPFYGSHETPPIQVHVGTSEILLDDSLRLGTFENVEVHVWQEMPHVFPSSIGVFDAAIAAHELIAHFLKERLT